MRRALAATALLLTLAACSRSRPNVVVVTFDTTRGDHMGYDGGPDGITPMLDAMAARGTWFHQAISTQPLTLPSHTSIFTGLFPPHHGVRNNGTYIVGQENVTLAERLRAAGYATHAVISAFVLDSQFGLDQGFDSYDDDLSPGPKKKMFMFKEVPAAETARRAVRWLEQGRPAEQPFFLWLHFFDPHADYNPPEGLEQRFGGDKYSGEIHYADRELGRVIKSLDDQDLLDDTLFVFTADHGDSLGDHGERTHGLFVYDATVRVPLLFAGPGVPAGRSVETTVRTVDITPTILDLIGIDGAASEEELDGSSLVPLMRGKADRGPRVAYVETMSPRLSFGWSGLRALRDDDLKVILAPRPEAYDLRRDPGEHHNLVASDGSTDLELVAERLDELRQMADGDDLRPSGDEETLTAEARQKLMALGYVFGTDSDRPDAERPDPKDRLPYWEEFQQGQALMRLGDYEQAATRISALLEVDAENVIARSSLANALMRMGRRDEGLEQFRKIMELDPRRETAYLGASRLLLERGELEEATALVDRLIEINPRSPDGYTARGDLFLRQERWAEAEQAFRKALEIDPHSSLAASGLGNMLNRAGRTKDALEILTDAYKRDRNSHALAYNLAVVTDRLGNPERALELYREAIQIEPDHSLSWNNLGSLLNRMGRRQEAVRMIAKAHELDPENAEACFNLAVMLSDDATQVDRALDLFDETARLSQELRPRALVAKGRVLLRSGRRAEALELFRDLAATQPGAWLRVALLELDAGRPEQARDALRRGEAQLGAAFRERAMANERLRSLLDAS